MRKIPRLSSLLYRLHQVYIIIEAFIKESSHSIMAECYRIYLWRFSRTKVWIGANYDLSGGVGRHIHAIKTYASCRCSLIPSDWLLRCIPKRSIEKSLGSSFLCKPNRNLGVVHSHVYPWFILWCNQIQPYGITWVHTYHLPYFPEHAPGVIPKWHQEFNQAQIEIGRMADVRISVSKWQKAYLAEFYGISTIYVPNGVDVRLCDGASSSRFLRNTGLQNYILNVSRNDPVKNPCEFIQLAQIMQDYQFVMIGPGLSCELFRNSYKLDVPSNVTILGGMSHILIQDAIASCSVLVSTARKEGLPTLVLEAMTHQKPIVVSNEPGSMEAIDNGRFGYYYSLGDLDDLRKNVLLALGDGEKPKLARQRVLEEYDWRVVARKLDAIYRGETLC